MPLNPKVVVKEDPSFGKGIFSVERIEEGEVIWWWDEEIEHLFTYSRAELLATSGEEGAWLKKYSYFVDEDLFGSQPRDQPMDVAYYFNHTCNPNCWYDGDDKLVAMRTIEPGEHVAYDYATTETELSFHAGMQCLCGSENCRGVLTFREYRNSDWLAKFEAHCTDFIKRKAHENGWANPNIYLKHEQSDSGKPSKGLYALDFIPKGEICLVFSGVVTTKAELQAIPKSHQHLWMQVNAELYQVARLVDGEDAEKADQINHSCNPTTVFEDSVTVIARRDISPGDEITFDYACVSTDPETESPPFQCSCGEKNCRGMITTDDWKLEELQKAYWPHFPPFMKKLILESNPNIASQ
eukprot:c6917_g1_i1.p1 GENE.c6917_g1_i1~~c6917_g1_i1.p1  ORF type:complete len:354 (+),score=50.47 c6917_g1_i1:106-1167(+)